MICLRAGQDEDGSHAGGSQFCAQRIRYRIESGIVLSLVASPSVTSLDCVAAVCL